MLGFLTDVSITLKFMFQRNWNVCFQLCQNLSFDFKMFQLRSVCSVSFYLALLAPILPLFLPSAAALSFWFLETTLPSVQNEWSALSLFNGFDQLLLKKLTRRLKKIQNTMTLLDTVEEWDAETSSERGKPEVGEHQRSAEALSTAGAGETQRLSECSAAVGAGG